MSMKTLASKTQASASVHLGIVCPMANERETAVRFVREVLRYCENFRRATFFAVLDRSSTDGTREALMQMAEHEKRIRVIWAPDLRCVVDAYLRGFREALAAGCDWIVEMDAGYSHLPDELPAFFDRMQEGYDGVFGSRFSHGSQYLDASPFRYFVSRAGSILTNLLLGTRLSDMTSGYELFTAHMLKGVLGRRINSRGHFFQTEIKVHSHAYRISEVPIRYRSPSSRLNLMILGDAVWNLLRLFFIRLGAEKVKQKEIEHAFGSS